MSSHILSPYGLAKGHSTNRPFAKILDLPLRGIVQNSRPRQQIDSLVIGRGKWGGGTGPGPLEYLYGPFLNRRTYIFWVIAGPWPPLL